MTEFESFSTLHYLCLVVCAIIAILAIILSKKSRGTENERRIRIFVGIGCLVIWLISAGYPLLLLPFHWKTSLPLQFCNIANLIGAIAVLKRVRLFKAVIYFWAFALCSWAFITPDLPYGPATPRFWIFWTYHVFILLSVVEVLVLQQFRPSWLDFRNAVLFTIAYTCILLVPNNLFKWNYGFVGPSEPRVPTIIDFLGPYPLRLLWMGLLGCFLFFLLLLPWLKSRGTAKVNDFS